MNVLAISAPVETGMTKAIFEGFDAAWRFCSNQAIFYLPRFHALITFSTWPPEQYVRKCAKTHMAICDSIESLHAESEP